MFESVDGRTDTRTPARVPSYKLTLWAFGSGELKMTPPDFKFYLDKLKNKIFPHMVQF